MKHDADSLARSLRSLPSLLPPAALRTSLRVIASQERQRNMIRRNPAAILRNWGDRIHLLSDHVMRSFVLPTAGGLSSAVVLFTMFVVPSYPLRVSGSADIPTELTTKVALKVMAPFANSPGDVVVDVRVDGQGRMIDYAIISGAAVLSNVQMRRRLENVLLFTEFTPATSFGQPMQSRLRLWFSSSYIDVRG